MGLQLFASGVLIPFCFGVLTLWLCGRFPQLGRIGGAIILIGITVFYALSIGWSTVPFPPVAAKHKFVLVLTMFAFVLSALISLNRSVFALTCALGMLLALRWLASSHFLDGVRWSALLLPITSILVIAIALGSKTYRASDDLSGVVSLLMALIGGAVIALTGGYIGLGQLLGAMAALWGGGSVVIISARLLNRTVQFRSAIDQARVSMTVAFGLCCLMLSSFATNLSPIAFLLTLATFFTPFFSNLLVRRIGLSSSTLNHRRMFLRGVATTALPLIPSGTGMVIATLNF